MKSELGGIYRRAFLNLATLCLAGCAASSVRDLWAGQLQPTPRQTEGPFYPDRMPPDTDNDLVFINDRSAAAAGTVAYLSGRVLDIRGEPVRNAVVEIWQCDNNGRYMHTGDNHPGLKDVNFQGFGRFTTGPTGEYFFRTIKPVPYPGRTPHIHLIVKLGGKRLLTTQVYIKDFPQNQRDFLYGSLSAPQLAAAIFKPLTGSTKGELAAHFDIVLGSIPEDPKEDRMRDLDRPQ
ncbi:MAG: intradiol ring-cleavage dioxygenase [Acidobacteria bacterium]|nr:intradiol ring-cleavage dioxygenase [Acidobacteriota bacterium]